METIARHWKAIAGFVAPGVIGLAGALVEGSDGGSSVTGLELVTILALMFGTSAGVYVAPRNRHP